MKFEIKKKVIKPLCIYSLAFSMLLPSVASLADLDINLGGYSVVYAAEVKAPKIDNVFIGDTSISGGNLAKDRVNKKLVIATVHVILKGEDGTVKATLEVTPKRGTTWKVDLTGGVKVAKGDTVTVYQQIGEDKSPEVTATAQPSKASTVTLTMPSGEIWIEQTSSNHVNDDEQAEAVKMFNDVNTAISDDIKSVKFSINTAEHAYYEVTYTDGSTSGKIEAPNLKIKTVTETSATPTIEKVQVTDGQIIVTLEKEVAAGTKFYFVKNFTDGEDKNFCENGSCKVDKSTSQDMSQAVSVDGTKVTFQINAADDLELGREFGIVVKEPHKFRSCAKSEPVITSPGKVEVRDPHKLTDADKKAIDKAIRDANTVNGKSKLPDGTGYLNDPAFIEFDKDGNVTIISPNDVEVTWDSDGNPIYAKNPDGTYKLQSGKENNVTKFPAKDLVKNIKPDAPAVKLSDDKKSITITPNLEVDTDSHIITVSYKDKDGKDQTTTATATKVDDKTTWSIVGEGTVKNGVITLPRNKVKGGTDVTAKVTDKGGIADDDKTPLTSEPGKLTVEETKADKVEALGGLDPVALKKWVGDTVDWKDGVKAKDSKNEAKVNELLNEAKTSISDEDSRGTTKEGDFTGKIKVTFDDGSFIEVENQNLYVSNYVTSVKRKDKVPTDALDVEFKLSEGTKVDNTDGTEIKGNKDNPVSYQKYMVKPQTNLKECKNETLKETYYNLINSKLKAIDKYTEPVWNGENGSVTENFIITDSNKVFTATATKTYDITFDANTGGGTKDKVTQKVNTEYELPAKDTFTPPNENQEFSGWQVGEDTTLKQPGAKIPITGDTVVKAIWKPIEFKATFQTEAGASGKMEEQTVSKGSKYELPKPTFTPEEGKEFAGWKVPGEAKVKKAGDEIDISGDVTLIATWKDIEYKVTFNGTEGKGSMPEKLVKKGDKYTLPENGFEAPKDKVFDGWMVGTEKKSAGDTITINGDTEVKAVWKAKPDTDEPGTKPDPNQPGKPDPNQPGTKPGEEKPIIPGEDDFYIPEFRIHKDYTPTYPVYAVVPKTEKVEKAEEVPVSLETHKAYIAGYEDNTLRAEGNLTRAEAAAMVTRLAGLDLSDNSMPAFKDMQKNAWYFRYINAAVKAKMLDADHGMMRPNDKITRAEFAKMLAAIDKENSSVSKFDDIKGHRYEKEINKIYGNNRIEGYEDGSFRPDAYLTRAESAAFLNRMFNRIADKVAYAGLEDNLARFKDFDSSKWYYDEMVEATNSHELTRRGKASDKYGRVYEKWTRILPSDVK